MALVVYSIAMPGTTRGNALRGVDEQDPSWWSWLSMATLHIGSAGGRGQLSPVAAELGAGLLLAPSE